MTASLFGIGVFEANLQRQIKLPLWEEFLRQTAEEENISEEKIDAAINHIHSNDSSWFWLNLGYPGDDCPHMENWLRPFFIELNRAK